MSSEDDAVQILSQSDALSASKTRFFFFISISVFVLERIRDNWFSRWPVGFLNTVTYIHKQVITFCKVKHTAYMHLDLVIFVTKSVNFHLQIPFDIQKWYIFTVFFFFATFTPKLCLHIHVAVL